MGLCSVAGPSAIVLGSTQDSDVVDAEQAARNGVDVVRRSSGGGAVIVAPAAQVWLDVWIPRDDPLWDDDVIHSSWWLGETWVRALEQLGAPELTVHRGRATHSDWSDVVCFAGVGPGEVRTGAAKVVGMAQRRTRHGARLHSMAVLEWKPACVLALLSRDSERAGTVHGGDGVLDDVATGVRRILSSPWHDIGADLVIAAVEDAVLAALP
jgi:lipoate---protein ligase